MFALVLIENPCDLYLVGCICAYPFSATTVDAHCPDKMEREAGIEPATFSLARRCSTTEPLPLVTIPLTGVLPLNQEAEIWAMRDSNSHGSRQQILSLPCLPVSAIAPVCVQESIEFPHLWMIHQRLDYCQDNFCLLPFGLAFFILTACSDGSSPSLCTTATSPSTIIRIGSKGHGGQYRLKKGPPKIVGAAA